MNTDRNHFVNEVKLLLIRTIFMSVALTAISACGTGDPTVEQSEASKGFAEDTVQHSEKVPDPARVEALKTAIKAEPQVIDFVYDPHAVFQWTIGVKDDGSPRYGYAGYICILISENGLPTDGTKVRVVDYSEFMRTQGDGRASSLGSVNCQTSQQMMP